MRVFPLPEIEQARLEALELSNMMDSAQEETFDRIARILSRTLATPIALVTFVGQERIWFKSNIGLDARETVRKDSFCAEAILTNEILEVEDTWKDDRFRDHPLVQGYPEIRYYAGAPLLLSSGHRLGTLCAIDLVPRRLSHDERKLLTDLAATIVELLELQSAAKKAIDAENRLLDAVNTIPDGFALYDKNDRLLLCNEHYTRIYDKTADLMVPGVHFEEIIRKGVERGQYADAIGNEEAWIAERMERHRKLDQPVEQKLPSGRWIRVEERRTREGGYVGVRVDITELKNQQAELSRLAWTDSLTGALNRRRFIELAEQEMHRSIRSGRPLALIMMDIDHFKAINDVYGHAAGDIVLIEMVRRWKEELRDYDILARVGGEEFAILLPDCDTSGATLVMQRLLERTSVRSVKLEVGEVLLTVSGGLVCCDRENESVESAIDRADRALYQAKQEGRNRFVFRAA